jgi:hypothetical protein
MWEQHFSLDTAQKRVAACLQDSDEFWRVRFHFRRRLGKSESVAFIATTFKEFVVLASSYGRLKS